MFGSNQKKIIVVSLVVLILVVFGAAWIIQEKSKTNDTTPDSDGFITRADVPRGTNVPELGDSNLPDNVAPPLNVVEEKILSSEDKETQAPSLRTFEVTIDEDKFTPDTVIVKKDDRVRIKFIAVDKDYDVSQPDYGLRQVIPKGSFKFLEFRASWDGQFTFFCPSCGGPEKGPEGFLIVKAQ